MLIHDEHKNNIGNDFKFQKKNQLFQSEKLVFDVINQWRK